MTLQTLTDQLEIQNLLVAYCHAVDSRNFDALDTIFTEDAFIDFSAVGGASGTVTEIKQYLASALQQFSGFQHMLGLPHLTLEEDKAFGRTICFNPMVVERDTTAHVFFVGIWYVDTFRRTDNGWRICARTEELSFFHNLPDDFKATPANQ